MHLILFDGDCYICNGFVKFVVPRDSSSKFYFSSLQSEYSKKLSSQHNIDFLGMNSMVLIKDYLSESPQLLFESSGVLETVVILDSKWAFLSRILLNLPKFLRDNVYRLVAKARNSVGTSPVSCEVIPGVGERII